MTRLSFFGAAGTVTGSCTMLETDRGRILVDCGMFQGNRTVRALNDADFPFDPSKVDALLLTHAHIDHSGLLPKLVKHGFRGPVHATAPTADLLDVMLADSARIQESNAERESKKRRRRGQKPVEPIYSTEHVEPTLSLVEPHAYEEWIELDHGLGIRFWNAGHILGSASVEIRYPEADSDRTMRILFSGDLGPEEKVFHPEPDAEQGFDYIVCESTYGDRERDDYTLEKRREVLRSELTQGLERGGNVVIPAFAVERSQELLHDIGVLLATDRIPDADVYLDSPLASRVTEVFRRHAGTLEDSELPVDQLFRDPRMKLIEDVADSKRLNGVTRGAIIISASGMADAGRIQHHLRNNIWRDDATVLFVGYQAPGTTGFHITSGASDVRIHGREYKIRARIRQIGNYSAHADQSELLDWILERAPVPGGIFLNHGDDDARAELRRLLGERGVDVEKVHCPAFDEHFEITADSPRSKGRVAQRIPREELLRDWYNDYAALVIDLGNQLEGLESAGERHRLLERVQTALEG